MFKSHAGRWRKISDSSQFLTRTAMGVVDTTGLLASTMQQGSRIHMLGSTQREPAGILGQIGHLHVNLANVTRNILMINTKFKNIYVCM